MSINPGRLTLDITREARGAVRVEWECAVEDYAVAKARVPKLSPVSDVWTYSTPLDDK